MTKLKIAVQKNGRLHERSMDLIKACNIKINNRGKLMSTVSNFPMDIYYLRDDDIPRYVAEGVADLGILGENEMLEKGQKVKIVNRLGFSKCRLSLAIRREEKYNDISWFTNKRIATSYPMILRKFLKKQNIKATIEEIGGSVEIAPGIGLSEAIFDIVNTGSTLLTHGLQEVAVVMESEAVLISNPSLSEQNKTLLDRLLFRIEAIKKSKGYKYILLNAPNEKLEQIVKLLPGIHSPTVFPLADKSWSSIHSVIAEDTFWEVIDQIRACGAEDILICPIEKMIL